MVCMTLIQTDLYTLYTEFYECPNPAKNGVIISFYYKRN